jgi:hypothetical protein
MSVRRPRQTAHELHNPGKTGGYPFLGDFKVSNEESHGHVGAVSKHDNNTMLGLRISGSNICVEGIQIPESVEELNCMLQEERKSKSGKDLGSPAVPFSYVGQPIMFPDCAKSYCLSMHVAKQHHRINHYCKLHIQTGAAGAGGAQGGAGGSIGIINGGCAEALEFEVDGEIYELGARAALPRGAQSYVVRPSAQARHAVFRPSNGLPMCLRAGGNQYDAAHGQDVAVPMSALMGDGPIEVSCSAAIGQAQAPELDVQFAVVGSDTVVTVTATPPCHLDLSTVTGYNANGNGMAQVRVPAAQAQRVVVTAMSPNGERLAKQTVSVPALAAAPAATAAASFSAAPLELEVRSAATATGVERTISARHAGVTRTMLSADAGARWHHASPGITTAAAGDLHIAVRLEDNVARENMDVRLQLAGEGKPAGDPAWVAELAALLQSANGNITALRSGFAGIRPAGGAGAALLTQLQTLLLSAKPIPALQFERCGHELRNVRCATPGFTVSPSGTVAVPMNAPVTMQVQAADGSVVSAVSFSDNTPAPAAGSAVPPCIQFKTGPKHNDVHGVQCSVANSTIRIRAATGSETPLLFGQTASAPPGGTLMLMAYDSADKLVAQCEVAGTHSAALAPAAAATAPPPLLKITCGPQHNDVSNVQCPNAAVRIKSAQRVEAPLPFGQTVPTSPDFPVTFLAYDSSDKLVAQCEVVGTAAAAPVAVDSKDSGFLLKLQTVAAQYQGDAEQLGMAVSLLDTHSDTSARLKASLVAALELAKRARALPVAVAAEPAAQPAPQGVATRLDFSVGDGVIEWIRCARRDLRIFASIDSKPRYELSGPDEPIPRIADAVAHTVLLEAVDAAGVVCAVAQVALKAPAPLPKPMAAAATGLNAKLSVHKSQTRLTLTGPPAHQIVCWVDGVLGQSIGSTGDIFLHPLHAHHVKLQMTSDAGQIVLNQELAVPRLLHPSFGVSMEDNKLKFDAPQDARVQVSVNDGPEKAATGEALKLAFDCTHHVAAKFYNVDKPDGFDPAATATVTKVMDVNLVVPPYVDHREVMELIHLYRLIDQEAPTKTAGIDAIVTQLMLFAVRFQSPHLRVLASVLATRMYQASMEVMLDRHSANVMALIKDSTVHRAASHVVHFRLRGDTERREGDDE